MNTIIEEYERALGDIERATGISDINAFIDHFKSVEEDNFALFIYVNEINNEVERLANDHAAVSKMIAELHKQEAKGEAKWGLKVKELEVRYLLNYFLILIISHCLEHSAAIARKVGILL